MCGSFQSLGIFIDERAPVRHPSSNIEAIIVENVAYLYGWLDVVWWDQPHLVAHFAYLATAKVSAAAGFHHNHATRELAEEL